VDERQIGLELRALREARRMSQEELGKLMGLSRTAVANIENGKRKLTAMDLITAAKLFGLTLDQLVHPELRTETVVEKGMLREEPQEPGLRVSMPQNRFDVFRQVLLYILSRVGARPHVGQTVLYKLLYFIDFDYYEKYEEQLIGATYIRNHYGPTPTHFSRLVDEMVEDGSLVRVTSEHFGYPQTKYLPVREPDLRFLSGRDIELVDEVLDRLGHMNATQISEYSHQDVPWMIAEEGKGLEYEAVYYRTPQYSVRDYEEDAES